jgi:biopolymer transport protein ExbB
MDLINHSLDYLRQGGWIMAPLGCCSWVMWMLILERIYRFWSMAGKDIEVGDAVTAVQSGELRGEWRGMRAELVQRYLQCRSGDAALDGALLTECVGAIKPRLRRSLAAISVLAAVAPLLGLLGTVIGMIETFDVISIFGTGNARAMAGGISVALITTQSGLLIAIPGLFLSGMLERKATYLSSRLDEVASALSRQIAATPQGGGERF